MADKKISALTSATTPLAGTEVLPIVQSGTTVKVSVDNLTAGKSVTATRFGAGAAPATVFDAAAGTGSDLNLRFSPAGWNTKHRLGVQYTGNGSVWSNNALMSSVTTGSLDDVSNSGSALLLETSGTLKYVTATAGANPRTFTQRFDVNTAGDFTLDTGNFVVGTAGKGIDFSANTGTAGMTSELLDWYEEGTYTPTVSATTGTITSFTATAFYTRIGRQVTLTSFVTITDAGTGAGTLTVSLPFTANGSIAFSGTGRENALTGSALQCNISAGGTVANVVDINNATVIATNAQVRSTVTYFV